MALAIHFDGLVRSGAVSDYGQLARLGRVSRPRISQIMGLLLLAPDMEELLALPLIREESGRFGAQRFVAFFLPAFLPAFFDG